MSSLTIRDVPEDLRQRIKRDAAQKKTPLSNYLVALLREAVDERDLRNAKEKLAEDARRKARRASLQKFNFA